MTPQRAQALAAFLGEPYRHGSESIWVPFKDDLSDADLLLALLLRAAELNVQVSLEHQADTCTESRRWFSAFDGEYAQSALAATPLDALAAAVEAYQGSKP